MPAVCIEKQLFLEIYRRQVDAVYRVCYSFMKNKPDAEDLVQETFLRLLSAKEQFADERQERAWLIIAASRLCRGALQKRRPGDEDLDAILDPAAAANPGNGILEAVFQLPPAYKDAVYMYYYEGYTIMEMADYYGCPESRMRSRLLQAKRKMQILLGGGE